LHYLVANQLLPNRKRKDSKLKPPRDTSVTRPTLGRPIVHTEAWSKVTVVLLDRHIAYLDRLAVEIRLRHHKAFARAELIRGLIEAAMDSGIDLSDAASIEEMVTLLNDKPTKKLPVLSRQSR
jgi:hypothetical protein